MIASLRKSGASWAAALGLAGLGGSVVLRYSYDQAARREERTSKLLFAFLGFVLGIAGTTLTQYLSRLIWPSH